MTMGKKKQKEHVNYYIHREMAVRLDKVLAKEGYSNDIKSRSELIGRILSHFLNYYEETTLIKAEMSTHVLADKLRNNNKT
jgi:metal-responsive CopG/Arc/MetJ family transcriptional regulator